jgi:amino acid transporter
MPLFGIVSVESKGHAVTTLMVALVAMLFTAISYGRMASVYPTAGSAYTYVGQGIHPSLGYLTGWAMLMDYVLNPLICCVWCGKAASNIFPEVPSPVYAAAFALLFTGLNLRSIRASAKTNLYLTIFMGVVVVWVLGHVLAMS